MIKKLTMAVSFVMVTSTGLVYSQPIVTESTSNSTNYSKSDATTKVYSPPPTAVAPAVTTINNDVCATAASGAVQTQILGISMGGTTRDMNCERIKLSKNLYDMGMKVAAVATLCQDDRVFQAMMDAGTPCPVDGKIGEQAKEIWTKRGRVSVTFPAPPVAKSNEVANVVVDGQCSYKGDDEIVRARICGK